MTFRSFVYCGLLELLVVALVRQTIGEDETEAMRAYVSDPAQLAAFGLPEPKWRLESTDIYMGWCLSRLARCDVMWFAFVS
jgi:hypothetical protein